DLQALIDDPDATETEIKAAQDALDDAVKQAEQEVEDAKSAATDDINKIPTNVSDDDNVNKAKDDLQALIDDPDSTETEIKAAQDALDDAVAQAEQEVEDAKSAATDDINKIPTNVSDDDNVNKAKDDLQALIDDPDATETQINDAKDKLDDAVKQAEQEVTDAKSSATDDIENIPTNVSDDDNVNKAKDDLQALIDDPDATETEIKAAQDALDDAVAQAEQEVEDAKSAATDDIAKIPTNVSDDENVNKAKDDLQALIDDPDATETEIKAAQDALDDAVAQAEKEVEDAKTVATDDIAKIPTNVSDDENVNKAKDDLQAVINDPDATETEIKAAQDALDDAVAQAEKEVEDAKTAATDDISSISTNVSDDDNVNKAKDDLQAVIDNPDSTETEIKKAQDALDDAVAQAEQEVTDAKSAATDDIENIPTNVSDDDNVNKAKDDLQALIDNPDSTETEIKAAQDALDDAVKQAEQEVTDAKIAATDDINNIPTNVTDDDNVNKAKDDLQALIDDPDATETQIKDAQDKLDDAVKQAEKEVEDAKSAATDDIAKIPTNVSDDDNVNKAKDDLQAVINDPDSTETEIKKAQDALDDAVKQAEQEVTDAKTAATDDIAKIPTNVSDDDNVNKAKDDLQALIDDPDATETQIKDAQDKLDDAVKQAEKEVEYAKSAATDDIAKIPTNVSDDDNVNKAKDDLQAVIDNPDSTETEIKAAQDALDDAVKQAEKEVEDAKSAATDDINKIPTNVSDDDNVNKAKDDLQALIDDPDATETEIKAAQDALDDAVKQAEQEVEDAKSAAADDIAKIPANVSDDDNVNKAKDDLQTLIDDPDATETDVKKAQDDLDNAIKTAENTVKPVVTNTDLADAVKAAQDALNNTAPVSLENAVSKAADNLKNILNDPNATVEQIENATKALEDATADAKVIRDDANKQAAVVEIPSSIAGNQDVINAKKALDDAIKNAANDKGTTQDILDALANLENAITIAENDKDSAIKKAQDALNNVHPVGNETAVKNAADALEDILNDPNATVEQIADATKNLQDATNAAKIDRGNAISDGNSAITTIPSSIADDPAVSAAKDALNKAIADSKNENATTADIQKAIDDLNDAIIIALQGTGDARAAAQVAINATHPVGNESAVFDAVKRLQDLLDDPNSTTTQIEDAIKALQDVTKPAKSDRNAAIEKANSTKIPANVVTDPAVKAAQDKLAALIAASKDEKATTQEILDAIAALNAAIASAESSNDSARTAAQAALDNVHPVGNESAVADAVKALQDLLNDPNATADAINAATDVLVKATESAKAARDEAIGTADAITIPTDVAADPAVKAAQEKLAALIASSKGEKATTQEILDAIAALNAAIATAQGNSVVPTVLPTTAKAKVTPILSTTAKAKSVQPIPSAKILPKTGESDSKATLLAGVAMLSAGFLVAYKRRKKQDGEGEQVIDQITGK
ncbi:LPXTG cell wall anchor domain-containing protein, partial [Pseudolactococcus insecticola]|uniref:LPXTG cell wall anchor domain-containing protein n=1 Tax=Pseudolactococcus insecticola TaxID=2709158 RepID=UPI001553C9C8